MSQQNQFLGSTNSESHVLNFNTQRIVTNSRSNPALFIQSPVPTDKLKLYKGTKKILITQRLW